MKGISKEEAKEILSPHIPLILNCVQNGVSMYFTSPQIAFFRTMFTKRSDASNCHDIIVKMISTAFEGTPGARNYYRNKLFLLNFVNRVVLRFKLFDRNLMSHNIMTSQQISIIAQDIEQLELEDMPPDGLLHVGYCMNELRTGVEKVYITYRNGNHNEWVWDLMEEATPAKQQIDIEDIQPARTTKRKITAKSNLVGDINENAN